MIKISKGEPHNQFYKRLDISSLTELGNAVDFKLRTGLSASYGCIVTCGKVPGEIEVKILRCILGSSCATMAIENSKVWQSRSKPETKKEKLQINSREWANVLSTSPTRVVIKATHRYSFSQRAMDLWNSYAQVGCRGRINKGIWSGDRSVFEIRKLKVVFSWNRRIVEAWDRSVIIISNSKAD